MSDSLTSATMNSVARFRVTRPQIALLIAAVIALVGVGYTSLVQSNTNIKQSQILSDAETPAASIIFTQRETLVYATRLAQWSNGGATRRQVQIARNLLAQRLSVIDSSGKSMGSRAGKGYWSALYQSDQIVDSAPVGVLPEALHQPINEKISPVIDEILSRARELVVSYQKSVDKEMTDNARRISDADRRTLAFFYTFLIFSALFLISNVRTNFKRYRKARYMIENEQKRLDETLRQLSEMQNTVAQLQDLDQAKNAFISTVNHELRTPLTSIIGYIDVIREEIHNGGADVTSHLEVLDRNAQILLNLVESMLSLSKIDSSQGVISLEKVSISDVIDDAIFVMRPAIEKAEITISHSCTSQETCYVRGDAGQLNQVFLNLIGNAIKFSPHAGSIEIRSKTVEVNQHDFIEIAVCDHGIGIPQEDLNSLFQRFFRAKNAVSQQYQGTGLGLAIVEQSLALHGATIEVESQVGEGTTFTIRIPAYPTAEEEAILERREGVLTRALDRLKGAKNTELQALTHELGGAIGFYGFSDEGEDLLQLSRKVSDEFPTTGEAFQVELQMVITSLEFQLREIKGDSHE